jgi:hypothetical protein
LNRRSLRSDSIFVVGVSVGGSKVSGLWSEAKSWQ